MSSCLPAAGRSLWQGFFMKTTFVKLKKKWGIHRTIDIILILIVFSLAGMSIVYVRAPVFKALEIGDTHILIKTIVYLLVVFPVYQFFLLFFGLLFGQFKFFWDKEKKMAKWVVQSAKRIAHGVKRSVHRS